MSAHSRLARLAKLAVLALAVSGLARAKPLSIERMVASPPLIGAVAQKVKPSPDGRWIGYLGSAPGDADATLLYAMPSGGGAPAILLDTRKLGGVQHTLTEAQMKALERRHENKGASLDYWWDADGKSLMAAYGGGLYLLSLGAGDAKLVVKPEAAGTDPQLAPGGRFISFQRDHDLYVHDVATGEERALGGGDARDTVSYGGAAFVDQEEIQRFTGAWWSPDGKAIAYTRVDEGNVTVVPRIKVDAAGLDVERDRFPLTGTDNAAERIFIRPSPSAAAVEVDLGANPDIYIADAAWSCDGKTFYVERQSRDQKRLDLLAVDPATGKSRVLVTETDPTWVDLEKDFRPLRDGSFLWGSSRTGWRHLYLYSRAGVLIRPVTSGAWRVADPWVTPDADALVGVDETKGLVYFIASKDTPLEQQLYSVSYRRPRAPRQMTEGHGWWTASMAAGTPTAFVGEYSDPTTPPRTGLYALDGRRLGWIAENRLDASHPYFPFLDERPTYAFGAIKAADGQDLHYMLAKPANFDPNTRYPVIVKVYGGPGVQLVRRDFRSFSDQIYTQAGYLIFTVDNRGSANRSEAFEHAISGALGGLSSDDQIAGVAFLKTLPFVDRDRIGMTGWSFGAYETVRVMTTPGSGVRAGVAGGTPSEFRKYDTHYTERFLGKPQDRAAAYDAAALLPRAKDLSGDLLLMHGMSDDNVALSNFTALVLALEKAGKTFDVDVFPGQSHAIRGEAAQTRQMKDALRFFDRTLAPRPSPSAAAQ